MREAVVGSSPERCAYCAAQRVSICDGLVGRPAPCLSTISATTTVPAGTLFVEQGAKIEHFYSIIAGCAAVLRHLADGRRQISGFLFQGDFFGAPFDTEHAWSAEAITDVTLCRFTRHDFKIVLDATPQLEARLYQRASTDLAAARDQLVLLGRKSAREKLASFLMLLHRHAERGGRVANPVHVPMSRLDIADFLGLTIETVSRTLTQLQRDRVIALEGRAHVRLLDHAALDQLVDAV